MLIENGRAGESPVCQLCASLACSQSVSLDRRAGVIIVFK